MPRMAHSHLGSGTVPYTIFNAPSGPVAADGELDVRDGDQVIVINPEDFSAYRSGTTKQVTLTPSTAERLDTGLDKRRAIAIANVDSSNVVYIGFSSSITVTGANGGFPVFPRTSISINCLNRLEIYGIAASAIVVGVMEVA